MNWNLTENGNALVPGNFLIAAIYDPDAPTVVLQSVVLPQPYTSTKNFSFTNLEEKIYNFILWENSTATVGGASRNSFSLQPTQNTTIVRPDLKLTAGVSTNFAVGAASYVADAPNDLTGWQYDVERKPQGTQFEGETIAIDDNGFHLLVAGDVFDDGEEWVLHFLPQTAVTAPVVTPAGQVIVPQIITGDIALDNSITGKTGLIQGTSSHLFITLPKLSTMPSNKVFDFISAGGNHLSAIFQCQSDSFPNTILWASGISGRITELVLGQNENIKFFKSNDASGNPVYYAYQPSDTIRMAGEIVYEYTTVKLNTTFGDGGTRDWNDCARLRNYVKQLPSNMVTTEALWGQAAAPVDGVTYFPNMAKYTLGDNATFFRVPLLFKYGFLRAVNGSSRFAGDLEPLQLLNHTQKTLIGNLPGSPNGHGPVEFIGNYNNQKNTLTDLTSPPWNVPGPGNLGAAIVRVGAENRPDDTGVYALIRT